MRRPTDEEINVVCAEVCNRCLHTDRECISTEEDGEFDFYFRCKSCGAITNQEIRILYTTDRNALPELWEAVRREGRIAYYLEALPALHEDESCVYWECWDILITSPRLHCTAALKALGRWPDEWSNEP